jgi:putative addiction module component (TIGR02574 family)
MRYGLNMSLSVTKLAEEVMALPVESRAYLAEKLLETLDFEEDFPVSEVWRKEIRKRCHELDEGTIQTIPAETAITELRKSLA